jgi:hypothetical protein
MSALAGMATDNGFFNSKRNARSVGATSRPGWPAQPAGLPLRDHSGHFGQKATRIRMSRSP